MKCKYCGSNTVEEETRDSGIECKRFRCFTVWRSDFGYLDRGRFCLELEIENLINLILNQFYPIIYELATNRDHEPYEIGDCRPIISCQFCEAEVSQDRFGRYDLLEHEEHCIWIKAKNIKENEYVKNIVGDIT